MLGIERNLKGTEGATVAVVSHHVYYLIIVNMRLIVNNHICRFRAGMDDSLGLTDRFERAAEVDQKWMPQIFMPSSNGRMINIVSILQKA